MKPRQLAALWVVVAVVAVFLLFCEIAWWRALTAQGAQASAERQRLTAEIGLQEGRLVAEMRGNSRLLQEMQWTAAGGDPAAFLARVADLAREKRMKVLAIGPVERQATGQFIKTGHAIQIQAPYRELRDLAGRVEEEKGLIEDLRIQIAPSSSAPGAPAVDEVQASFRMAALEISSQARQIIERAIATGGGAAQQGGGGLALPVPPRQAQLSPLARDPFVFAAPPVVARAAGERGTAGPAPAERPPVTLELRGTVNFPDGQLAIVNNQIVKVGDMVGGLQVERITETAVTLRDPGSKTTRTVELPNLLEQPPAAPRR